MVFTGGLGPTSDDLTREAVAETLDLPLDEDPETIERLERRFARRGMPMPANNRKQALVPRGAEVLANDKGTAPGLLIDHAGKLIVLLPGPPREMKPMLEALLRGRMAGFAGGRPDEQSTQAAGHNHHQIFAGALARRGAASNHRRR